MIPDGQALIAQPQSPNASVAVLSIPDAARFSHFAHSGLQPGPAFAHARSQRGYAPARLLPPSRSPPLRHALACGRHDEQGRQTRIHGSRILPRVSPVLRCNAPRTAGFGRGAPQLAGSACTDALSTGRSCRRPRKPDPHARRTRTSRDPPRLRKFRITAFLNGAASPRPKAPSCLLARQGSGDRCSPIHL
jgi:hypothetical protein